MARVNGDDNADFGGEADDSHQCAGLKPGAETPSTGFRFASDIRNLEKRCLLLNTQTHPHINGPLTRMVLTIQLTV